MADHNIKQSNLRRQMGNKVILLAISFALLVIPGYIGVAVAFVLYYGNDYIPIVYQDPGYLFDQYGVLFDYWLKYHDNPKLPQDFVLKVIAPPAGGIFSSLFLFYMLRAPLLDFRPFKMKESVHGDAHWATEPQIRKAKLRAKKGFLLGRTGANNYLICDDFQHVLLFAPTGSGKGVGFVIPNLLFWQESLVCHDIKLENHELTSGYRKKSGRRCICGTPPIPMVFRIAIIRSTGFPKSPARWSMTCRKSATSSFPSRNSGKTKRAR